MTSQSQVSVPGPAPQKANGSLLRRKRLLIVGVIVVGALGYLGYTAFMGAATYYLTVNELMTRGVSASNENVRVMGTVVAGSVQKDPATNSMQFAIQDKGGGATKVPVEYKGVVPDAFKEGADVVMEGALGAGGTFKATNLLVKCPSKYEAAASQTPGGGTQ